MGFFTRKSNWDRLWDTVLATTANGDLRQVGKVTASVLGGAIAATAASAAVSSIRQDKK
jgi:uncharacterized protein (DUF697 family)